MVDQRQSPGPGETIKVVMMPSQIPGFCTSLTNSEESEEECEPTIKKRTPQPEVSLRKYGDRQAPEMVDGCCKGKTYI